MAVDRARRTMVAGVLTSLLSIGSTLGCAPPGDARETEGVAHVRFDGFALNGPSGITCRGRSDGAPPWFLETRGVAFKIGGDAFDDWRVIVNARMTSVASLHLQVTPGKPSEAAVAFAVDDTLYRSGNATGTTLEPGWENGRVVFTDVPLVEGRPFRGRQQLDRLVISWTCRAIGDPVP